MTRTDFWPHSCLLIYFFIVLIMALGQFILGLFKAVPCSTILENGKHVIVTSFSNFTEENSEYWSQKQTSKINYLIIKEHQSL